MELSEKAQWRLSLGHEYLNDEQRNVPAAAREFRRVTELAPDWVEGYLLLGAALEEIGERDEAISTYRAAMKVAPEDARPLIALGSIYIRQHEYAKASKILRRAILLHPDSEEANHLLSLANVNLESAG